MQSIFKGQPFRIFLLFALIIFAAPIQAPQVAHAVETTANESQSASADNNGSSGASNLTNDQLATLLGYGMSMSDIDGLLAAGKSYDDIEYVARTAYNRAQTLSQQNHSVCYIISNIWSALGSASTLSWAVSTVSAIANYCYTNWHSSHGGDSTLAATCPVCNADHCGFDLDDCGCDHTGACDYGDFYCYCCTI